MKPTTTVKMKSRLFHAVIAGGVALAVPIGLTACSSDPTDTGTNAAPDGAAVTPGPGGEEATDSGGNGPDTGASHGDSGKQDAAKADAGSDAGDGGAIHDADPDADGGWPPTK